MSKKHVMIGDIDCGSDQLFLIAGPCVIEEESLMMRTAERLQKISASLDLPLVFKSSFSKDNRSSLEYYQGPGLEAGLKLLEKIKREFELPILTDIHYPYQAAPAAEVCDVIQIPAYLCMQSELVVAAAKTGAVVNIKHGQFLATTASS
jgi:2-dehydro-3-deoxyphosphooctonate aldolase (KDO 8-P synthase)